MVMNTRKPIVDAAVSSACMKAHDRRGDLRQIN